jgi:phospholipid transport system substrate-binding protein
VNERVDGPYADVGSKISTAKGEEYSINYKAHLVSNEWKVYDVVAENVSLVNNYRSQFNRVISHSSYEDLISRLKNKSDFAAPKKGR